MSLSDFPETILIVGDLDHVPETGELLDGGLRIAVGMSWPTARSPPLNLAGNA
jgi:hypothetical protein